MNSIVGNTDRNLDHLLLTMQQGKVIGQMGQVYVLPPDKGVVYQVLRVVPALVLEAIQAVFVVL